MANTLIIRSHRIGDALLVLPLVRALGQQYPNDNFTLITFPLFMDLASMMPQNVTFLPMVTRNPKGAFRGIIFQTKRKIFLNKITTLLDSVDKVAFFQFDTFEKKLLKEINKRKKKIEVATTEERVFQSETRIENRCQDGLTIVGFHKETLRKLEYLISEPATDSDYFKKKDISEICTLLRIDKGKKMVAISPFSREKPKIYPLERMEQIVSYFASREDEYQVLVLGGGEYEKNYVEAWLDKYPNVISLIGKLPFASEVSIISHCAIALAMDSFNLHLASFLNTPIVSLWGPTLPANGYCPEGNAFKNAIFRGLDCQPCSIFGGKECNKVNKYECFDISAEEIIEKMERIMKEEEKESIV